MRGTIPPLPNMPSWHGAQLKHRYNSTSLYNFIGIYICEDRNVENCFLCLAVEILVLRQLRFKAVHLYSLCKTKACRASQKQG